MADDWATPDEQKVQRKLVREAKAREARDDNAIQSLMATSDGRGWMHDLLERCHIFHPSFTGEALGTAFREGERAVGLQLLAGVMRACADAYVSMMKEQNDGGRTDDNRDPTDDNADDG